VVSDRHFGLNYRGRLDPDDVRALVAGSVSLRGHDG